MRIAVLTETDKDLGSLAARLFSLKEAEPKKVQLVKKGLLRENPVIEKIESLSPGTLLVVPEMSEGSVTADSVISDGGMVEVLEAVRKTLEKLEVAVKDTIGTEKEEFDKLKKAAATPDVRVAVKENDEMEGTLAEILDVAANRLKDVTTLKAAYINGLHNTSHSLSNFRQR
jgi:hypothetical protein